MHTPHRHHHHPLTCYEMACACEFDLTHWGWVTHICVSKLTIVGSDNGLSPDRCQAIIWTNAGLLLIGPLRTNFSEILIGIEIFSFRKKHLKMSSAKWRPFCLGLNVLTLVVVRLECSGITRSLPWRLMTCLLTLPGYWQPNYRQVSNVRRTLVEN